MTFQTKRSLNGWKCFLYVDFRESVFFEKVMRSSPENVRGRQKFASACPEQLSGDHSAVAPPVPIPNTEVKRCSPDGSASIGCARVGRRQNFMPGSLETRCRAFFSRQNATTPARSPPPESLAISGLVSSTWLQETGLDSGSVWAPGDPNDSFQAAQSQTSGREKFGPQTSFPSPASFPTSRAFSGTPYPSSFFLRPSLPSRLDARPQDLRSPQPSTGSSH